LDDEHGVAVVFNEESDDSELDEIAEASDDEDDGVDADEPGALHIEAACFSRWIFCFAVVVIIIGEKCMC
jgi:hypothetical protein